MKHGMQRFIALFAGGLVALSIAPATFAEEVLPAGSKIIAKRPTIDNVSSGQGAEHPLMPALRWAEAGMANIRAIQDYQCTFIKRERIDGKLGQHEYFFCKVRHNPLSIYLYFLAPEAVKGQEVIYVKDRNNNKLVAQPNGFKGRAIGTVELAPDGMFAMEGNRYPITELGILNLSERLIDAGRNDTNYGECEVQFFKGTKINGRSCTCIQVIHPIPRRNFIYHMARIFIDDELVVPIRYAAWSWPRKPGGEPVLEEEYTYLNLKINNNFTDADFDRNNSAYNFR